MFMMTPNYIFFNWYSYFIFEIFR